MALNRLDAHWSLAAAYTELHRPEASKRERTSARDFQLKQKAATPDKNSTVPLTSGSRLAVVRTAGLPIDFQAQKRGGGMAPPPLLLSASDRNQK
jgi:hypothetical protein